MSQSAHSYEATLLVPDSIRISSIVHVAHEVVALRSAWQHHKASPFAWTAWFVHVRNLHRFFDGSCGREDDLLALHFFDPPSAWDAKRPPCQAPGDLSVMIEAANKLASHLTLTRVRMAQGDGFPPSEAVTRYLECLAAGFMAALPPDLAGAFSAALATRANGLF